MRAAPVVVVLAAGRGSRFAGPDHKLLQNLGTSTVLGRTLQHAIASHLPVVVVTTEPLASLARRSVAARDVVVLPEIEADDCLIEPCSLGTKALGMGHSISAGIGARPDAPGWLILPGDMPQVQPSTLKLIAGRIGEDAVVYAQHKGRRGHPVGFSAEMYSELIMLTGDEGARRLVARYASVGVEVDDAGVLQDVDTVDDLDLMRRRVSARSMKTPSLPG